MKRNLLIVTMDESADLITAFPSFGDYHKYEFLRIIILVRAEFVGKGILCYLNTKYFPGK